MRYVVQKHKRGKTARYYIVGYEYLSGFMRRRVVVREWMKYHEVQAWLDLLKEY